MINYRYQKILNQYHTERNTKAFYKTKGFKKLWYYVCAIIKKDKFQEYIKDLRNEYKIPIKGFHIETDEWIHPPKQWLHAKNRSALNKIRKNLRKTCLHYSLLPRDWMDILESYLFYNKLFISLEPDEKNLCFVSDALTKMDSLGRTITKDESTIYPIILHISPYASKRDVLNYIEDIYKTEISPLQKKHQKTDISIGKHRKKNKLIQERNKFIYENRHLSRKKITGLITASRKFKSVSDPIDPGSVGKIISLEKKQRKEV